MERPTGWIGALVVALLLCAVVPASASADYRRWYLNNANDGSAHDIAVNYGDSRQTPVAGDWDANGTDTPGAYEVATARWWLADSFNGSTQAYFTYGSPGFIPVVGDWDGNRSRSVGAIQLPSRWYLSNVNGPVVGSIAFNFGGAGDTMLTGDWNGDGKETPGIYHRSNAQFWLSNSNTGACCDKVFVFGNVGDVPVVGDWNDDGIDTIGVLRSSASGARWFLNNQNDSSLPELNFYYGNPGDTPITGDWDGDGRDTVGVVRTFASATPSPPPVPDPYPTSTRYGGADGITTDAEMDAVSAALQSSVDFGRLVLWLGLSPGDQADMVIHGADREPAVSWLSTFDTDGPSAPGFLDGWNESAEQITFTWESGEDPDIGPEVPGSGVAEAQYRIRRTADWSSWRDVNGQSITVDRPVDDQYDLEVRERDAAGNWGPTAHWSWPQADSDEPDWEDESPEAVIACPWCVGFVVAVCKKFCDDAARAGWKKVRRIPAGKKVPIRRPPPTPAQVLDTWKAARGYISDSASRKALRKELREGGFWKPAKKPKDGDHAHHIVPLNGTKSARAMDIMNRCGFKPNSGLNGVWLSPKLHKRTLKDAYRETVNEILEQAYNRHGCYEQLTETGVEGALKMIARRLEAGTMPG